MQSKVEEANKTKNRGGGQSYFPSDFTNTYFQAVRAFSEAKKPEGDAVTEVKILRKKCSTQLVIQYFELDNRPSWGLCYGYF